SVQLIVSDNGKTLKTVFFVTNGLQYIKGMTLNGKSAQVIKHSATAADYIFEVTPEILAGLGNVHFSLTTPIGDMEEDAFAVFNLSNQSSNDLRNKIQQKLPDSAPVATGTNLINPTKTVQYIPYKVLDETRSKLSTANNYYTHTAKVVKDSSGYKVYLTVQAPTGYVKFQPLSVNYGGYSDFSHSTAGGNDIWTYAFHISNEQGLDQPIPATISMTVPIAGINDQQFEVWLSFGKAQGGGTNYLAAVNAVATQGLPATTISLVQAANGNTILPAAGTSLTAISATQPTKAVKATKPAKTAANKTKKVAAATTITAAEQQKSAKLKDYPFMAEIAGFGAVALVIIGFAVYKRLHVGE
ncbi:NEAT domain-containing protein, partial [Loigolactobacillus coryniformis subsp. coryniformis]|uniref:NEAT domain-containing protein n=1 Tax=Loigolactobacillus coryniformis TaxID=1610 RepID=UPI003993880E